MRAVGLSDLDLATRALLAVPRDTWSDLAAELIEQAHNADVWRKRTGSAHPGGGTGSLYAQASLLPRTPTSQCSVQYCAALSVVLQALENWRGREAVRTRAKSQIKAHRFDLGKSDLNGVGQIRK